MAGGNTHPSHSIDPKTAVKNSNRVFRGGSWRMDAAILGSVRRGGGWNEYRMSSLGFRLVRTRK